LIHEDDILLSQNLQSLTAYMDMSPNDLDDLQKFVGEKPKWYRNGLLLDKGIGRRPF
jgi:hypothetical protein